MSTPKNLIILTTRSDDSDRSHKQHAAWQPRGRFRYASAQSPGARRQRHEAHTYQVPRVKTGAVHRKGQEPLGDDFDRAYYSHTRS